MQGQTGWAPVATSFVFYAASSSMFDNVVAVVFRITFRAEMHANGVFLFLKKLFLTSAHQNDSKHIKF